MGQWEPLADRIPLDMRRLATQLRRMKDRSGLTVPSLAARTGQSAETWALALAGRRLPPLDAVETLAQACGADYDRIGALYALAEKAGSGAGDLGRGRPVPHPDPLDPLGPQEGLPGGGRRALLLLAAGVLAAAALVAVMLTSGTSTGRAPDARDSPGLSTTAPPRGTAPATSAAGPSAPGAAPAPAGPDGVSSRRTTSGASPGTAEGDAGSTRHPATASGQASPSASSGPPGATVPAPGHGDPSGGPGTTPTAAPSTSSPPPPSPPSTPAPGPTSTALCLRVLVLGVCLG
jgi:transcriptional regulator with XRE-family HTH domain